MQSRLCSKCGKPARLNQRYCRTCHAAYQRKWAAGRTAELKELRSKLFHVEQSEGDHIVYGVVATT